MSYLNTVPLSKLFEWYQWASSRIRYWEASAHTDYTIKQAYRYSALAGKLGKALTNRLKELDE